MNKFSVSTSVLVPVKPSSLFLRLLFLNFGSFTLPQSLSQENCFPDFENKIWRVDRIWSRAAQALCEWSSSRPQPSQALCLPLIYFFKGWAISHCQSKINFLSFWIFEIGYFVTESEISTTLNALKFNNFLRPFDLWKCYIWLIFVEICSVLCFLS